MVDVLMLQYLCAFAVIYKEMGGVLALQGLFFFVRLPGKRQN